MSHPVIARSATSRVVSAVAVVGFCIAIALSGDLAQGRVDPLMGGRAATAESANTIAKVTGGGTVLAWPTYPSNISSFGLNARRPVGFSGGGPAEGRINYNRHRNSTGRHVNIPVTLMQAFVTGTPTPNGTGGTATIIGDCTAPGSECPTGKFSALVYVEDNSDSGAGTDIFRISFCGGLPQLPAPDNCSAPEGGYLRTGNIQVRGDPGVLGEQMSTAAAAGVFPTTPTFNGVELAGGIYGVGVRTGGGSTYGDLHVEFTGISPIGLYQIISVDGWITSGSIAGGALTFSGTATLDMGDGPPPTGGLPLTGTLAAAGITVTVGGSTLPTLPKTDGFTVME
jgi:hypothetical protein